MSALTTRLCPLFGVRYPIFGLTHSVPVALAIAQAGGFPVLALARFGADEAREQVGRMRAAVGDRPWGVNCLLTETLGEETDRDAVRARLPAEHLAFVDRLREKYRIPEPTRGNFFSSQVRSNRLNDEHAEIALASGASAFSTAIGTPQRIVQRAKAAGMTTIASVGAPRHAARALAAGIDVLVAQGGDAGGHTGPIGTFSLVPQIVDAAAGRPVIAAGGVGTGRHIAAAFAMGAEGVWLGTAWLTALESGTDEQLLAKLLGAGSGDTTLTRAHSGKSARVLKSAWTDEWSRREAPAPLPMPLQQVLTGELLAGIEEHRLETLRYELCGQSIAWFNEATSVKQIVERLVGEAQASLDSMLARLGRAPTN